MFAARLTPQKLDPRTTDANNKRRRVINVRKCAKEVHLPLMAIRQPEPKKGEAAAAWCLTARHPPSVVVVVVVLRPIAIDLG